MNAYNPDWARSVPKACARFKSTNVNPTRHHESYTTPWSCIYDLHPEEVREIKMLVDCNGEEDWGSCDPARCSHDAPPDGPRRDWCDYALETTQGTL